MLRPATPADLPAIGQLAAECFLADFEHQLDVGAYLARTWQAPGLVLERDAWVAAAGSEVLGFARLRETDAGQCDLDIMVRPGERTGGWEAELLAQAEQQAPGNQPRLLCRASGSHTALVEALDQRGYARQLTFLTMELALDRAPPAPVWPSGLNVRTFVPGEDEQATYAADEEASTDKGYYEPRTFEAWSARMRLGRADFDPSLWLLAWDGAEVAGVALNYYTPENGTGWVDHLGVRRPWRQRGLGQALLLAACGEFHRRGATRVRLNVDAHSLTNATRLYERIGMQTVQQYHFYAKALPERTA